jgi:hypothetical protein
MGELVLRSKHLLDPRILVREGEFNALWNGAAWQVMPKSDSDALLAELVPVRGRNVRRDVILRARSALDRWE